MTIAVTPDQQSLRESVRRWAARHAPLKTSREAFGVSVEVRPDWWSAAADQGLLGMGVSDEYGGAGATMVDMAILIEELGHSLVAGPLFATIVGSALVQRTARQALAKELLPGVAAGELCLGLAVCPDRLTIRSGDADDIFLSGEHRFVLSGAVADHVVVPVLDGGQTHWFVIPSSEVVTNPVAGLDPTRPVARVVADDLLLRASWRLELDDPALPGDLISALGAAEAAGVAAWCLETATDYAGVRQQFGRPIGAFQAIKHRCADMLVRVEEARAVAWDAAAAFDDPEQRAIAVAVAGAVALDAAVDCAKDCIQVLGGVGFTWEHDAHLFLRRATAIRQLLGGGDQFRVRIGRLTLDGVRRNLSVELSDDGACRAEVRALLEAAAALSEPARREALVDGGFLAPHWPRPWGRSANPEEQLVIQEEARRSGLRVPGLLMGDWVLPTLIAHGTDEQRERFMRATLLGQLTWCQMFSEPGAGSDLASLATRAERVEGGWVLNGQKVWTSIAQYSDWAICLARTNPDVPKHEGISYFLVDMKTPGLDVRPLRELTGHEAFNEVFLDDVFVPDDCLVGELDGGWAYARTTLDSERVAISDGIAVGANMEAVVELVRSQELGNDGLVLAQLGAHLACETTLSLLSLRSATRTLAGLESGPASSVRKLVSAHHKQDVAEFGLGLLGPGGAAVDGAGEHWIGQFLLLRSFTIFGGTSEIQRNVIGERILGLPRDGS